MVPEDGVPGLQLSPPPMDKLPSPSRNRNKRLSRSLSVNRVQSSDEHKNHWMVELAELRDLRDRLRESEEKASHARAGDNTPGRSLYPTKLPAGALQISLILVEHHMNLNRPVHEQTHRLTLRRAEPMKVAVSWMHEFLTQIAPAGAPKALRALYSASDATVLYPCSSDHGLEPIVHHVLEDGMVVVASFKPLSSLVAKEVASASAHRRLHGDKEIKVLV
eukprot:TRINITY_DN57762_c0_g1_i1.p1 TRINITY_DN57762_c0_g1~~TRINITY_DN57762_c0_g1_i1.p1  ORF type:complete len:220 (+),score=46.75 TRINITY_DN57762_c0_g1_i1:170-829(+)